MVKGYDLRLKKKVDRVNPQIVNKIVKGRRVKFVKGRSRESGVTVYTILPQK